MRALRLLALALGLTASMASCSARAPARPPATPTALRPDLAAPARFDRAAAVHLLDRFTFGPRPGDVDHLLRVGADAWFEQQLSPRSVADRAGQSALDLYRDALGTPRELVDRFDKDPDDYGGQPALDFRQRVRRLDTRRLLGTLEMAELSRDISSARQVEQVMVDFWTNHFNVYARKGLVRLYAADYVEHVIRPHALGHFEDLLVASARHPAMLLYLDNVRSSAAKSAKGRSRGINENYARELMELHTLGVNGGYTQADVIAVARILTGWSIERPRKGGVGFVFCAQRHDFGQKVALGKRFPAGHGEDEGLRLLHLLAESQATARHIARELCQRFVADSPPKPCIDRVSATYLRTEGDIASMLRTIVHSPEFWSPAFYHAKVKSPLEFVASAVRALGGAPDGSLGLARVLGRLGEPLLLQPVPTGYGDRAEDWASSDALLGRMNFSVALAADRAPGVNTRADQLVLPTADPSALAARVNRVVLAGQGSAATLATIERQVARIRSPERARRLALALALGSPDFQRR